MRYKVVSRIEAYFGGIFFSKCDPINFSSFGLLKIPLIVTPLILYSLKKEHFLHLVTITLQIKIYLNIRVLDIEGG